MSGKTLISSIPAHVSLRRAVNRSERITGIVEGNSLKRVAEATLGVENFDVDMQFGRNESDKRCVQLSLAGAVYAECQRCLDEVLVPVSVDMEVVFVAHDDEARSVLKSVEPWVVSDDKLDIYELLEDEILLALPPVAMHPEFCVVAGYEIDKQEPLPANDQAIVDHSEKAEKPNPFAALKGLKALQEQGKGG